MNNNYNLNVKLIAIIIITVCDLVTFTLCERRVLTQEWAQTRFGSGYGYGGMGLGSDANEWPLGAGLNVQSPDTIEITGNGGDDGTGGSGASDGGGSVTSSVETSVQSIDVGKDNLVFVNDQGSIKMLRASQLPTVNKQSISDGTATTPAPSTVLQIPLEQYLANANNNPTKNPIQYMTGRQSLSGLPLTFASSRVSDNPCRVMADSAQPIYIPAQSTPVATGVLASSDTTGYGGQKMVKIIIEMPESLTRDIDEASRYAASQVKRLRQRQQQETTGADESSGGDQMAPKGTDGYKPKRKVRKNIHEIIRKVVELEEDSGETADGEESDGADGTGGQPESGDNGLADDMVENANQKHEKRFKVVSKVTKHGHNSRPTTERYIVMQRKRRRGPRKGKSRSGDRRKANMDALKSVNKYKNTIRVYKT